MRNWKLISFDVLSGSNELLNEFYNDYQHQFGSACKACRNKLFLYYKQLIKTNNIMTKTKTCKLKPSINIYDAKNHKFYNDATITDEVAREYIARNKNNAKKFLVLPDAVKTEQKVEKVVDQTTEKVEKETTEEVEKVEVKVKTSKRKNKKKEVK